MTHLIKTILHVDDDADDRELLEAVMQQVAPDLKVIFAENGLQALDLLQARKGTALPSLIVLDLNMPYLSGVQTFERIKADPQLRGIPLVILSTSESPAEKALFHKGGIPFFTKPVDFFAMKSLAGQMANLCS
jgi:two-component system response regulator